MRADVERAIAGLPVTAPVPVMGLGQDTAVLTPVGGVAAPASDGAGQRGPLFWVLLTLGVIAVGVATVLVGRAIFGSPAVEQRRRAQPQRAHRRRRRRRRSASRAWCSARRRRRRRPTGRRTPSSARRRPRASRSRRGRRSTSPSPPGKAQATVPQLVGLTSPDAARAALVDAGLTLGKVTPGAVRPAGRRRGRTERPVPDDGRRRVPRRHLGVRRQDARCRTWSAASEAQARSDLTNAGFVPNVVTQAGRHGPRGPGARAVTQGRHDRGQGHRS